MNKKEIELKSVEYYKNRAAEARAAAEAAAAAGNTYTAVLMRCFAENYENTAARIAARK